MLTPDQWRDLARFSGITIEENGCDINGLPWYWSPELENNWCPDTDWNDFGPLLVLLLRWNRGIPSHFGAPENTRSPRVAFERALYSGTDQDIMQAGCLLGAAIGATMKQESK